MNKNTANNKWYWITAGILLLLGAAYGIYRFAYVKNPDAKQETILSGQKNASAKMVIVETETVAPREYKEILNSIGETQANEEVDLRSEISGIVREIYFQESTQVKKGTLLVKINDSELQAQLRKAESLKALSEARERRQKILLDKDIISSDDYDNALTNLQTAISDIELFKAEINKTEIKAPFDGIIGIRNISPGDYISPNTSIAYLVSNNPIKVTFDVPEKYSSRIRTKMPIYFTVEGQNRTFEGEVYAVSPRADPTSRSIQMRAMANNDDGALVPGAFVKVKLQLAAIQTLMIPSECVIPDAVGQSVFIVKDGKAVSVKVEIGARTQDRVQIVSGLNSGDKVVTSGILQLTDGTPVSVAKEK